MILLVILANMCCHFIMCDSGLIRQRHLYQQVRITSRLVVFKLERLNSPLWFIVFGQLAVIITGDLRVCDSLLPRKFAADLCYLI